MSPVRSLAGWIALPAGRRRELGVAAAALVSAQLGLVFFGLRRMQRITGRVARSGMPVASEREVAEHSARLVASAARHLPTRPTCLPSSLALRWLLARQGIETDLRLGVRKVDDGLDAHAWLEHRGIPVSNGDAARRYLPFGCAR